MAAEHSDRIVRFAAFELDLNAGELRRSGVRLPVQGRPLQVLALLVRYPGRVVTAAELRSELWPADTFVDFDHGVRNAMARLRAVLGDTADRPRYIETVPRRGYRFIGNVSVELPAETPVQPTPVDSAPAPFPAPLPAPFKLEPEGVPSSGTRRNRWRAVLTGTLSVAVLAGAVAWTFLRVSAKSDAGPRPVLLHLDLTARSRAPLAAGRPFGYFCGANMAIYRGIDGHLHDMYWPAIRVEPEDLTSLSKAPPPAGDSFAYTLEGRDAQIVLYRGVDGHVHELHWSAGPGEIAHDDLTDLFKMPVSAGDPRGYEVSVRGAHIAIFRGVDGRLFELVRSHADMRHADLTTLGHAPAAAGEPSGYYFDAQNMQVIVYRGVDGRLHSLYWTSGSGQVNHNDLTELSHAPAPSGDPVAVVAATYGVQAVFYRGTDGHLHELYWSTGAVGHQDLTRATRTPLPAGNPAVYFVPQDGTYHVVYRSSDGHVHELRWRTGEISHEDLTVRSATPNASDDPSGYYVRLENEHHVIYRSEDGHVHELRWSNVGRF